MSRQRKFKIVVPTCPKGSKSCNGCEFFIDFDLWKRVMTCSYKK